MKFAVKMVLTFGDRKGSDWEGTQRRLIYNNFYFLTSMMVTKV